MCPDGEGVPALSQRLDGDRLERSRERQVMNALRRLGARAAVLVSLVVVAGGHELRMSASDRRELEAWVAEQAARLRDASSRPPARRARPDRQALQDLERLVNDALGTRTVQRRATLRDS